MKGPQVILAASFPAKTPPNGIVANNKTYAYRCDNSPALQEASTWQNDRFAFSWNRESGEQGHP